MLNTELIQTKKLFNLDEILQFQLTVGICDVRPHTL